MVFYATVVFDTNASVAERHHDVSAARRWIDEERDAKPKSFSLGLILDGTPDRKIVATCDSKGWRAA